MICMYVYMFSLKESNQVEKLQCICTICPHLPVSPISHSYLVCQSNGIFEKKQVALSQPDDITRVKLHFFSQHFAIPRDHGVLTRAEHGGAADAMAMEIAVSRKDVSGKEKDVRLCPIFMIAMPTKYNVWPSK